MTDSWVGGDIGGLRTMGEAYKKAKTDLESIVKPLSTSVDALAKDTGWQGESAESFRAKWTEDAMTVGGFAELVHAAGQILTDLADHLGKAEAALQNAEDVAVRAGVPIQPMGVPGQLMTNDPPGASEQKAIKALNDYATVRGEILHTAQQARLDAAEALRKLYAEDTGAAVSPGDKITVADSAAATAGGVALAASAENTVPVAVVAGVGGAVVIGATGLLDESFHEHWSEDIHDHGVLGGLWHGSGNVLSNTGGDLKRLGDDAAGLGKKAWNGFKGLF
uniref:WXG100 family type VII secretion target n=1 Tax=Streptomyces sp. NBC_00003 TaxID=2903608 RepID=A0AAU2V118_9ACTN